MKKIMVLFFVSLSFTFASTYYKYTDVECPGGYNKSYSYSHISTHSDAHYNKFTNPPILLSTSIPFSSYCNNDSLSESCTAGAMNEFRIEDVYYENGDYYRTELYYDNISFKKCFKIPECPIDEQFNTTTEQCEPTCPDGSHLDNNGTCIPDCTTPNTEFPNPANNEGVLFTWSADANKSQLCTDTLKGTIQSKKTNCEDEYRCIKTTEECRVPTNEPINSYVSPVGNVFHEDIPLAGSALDLHYSSAALDANLSTDIAYGWSVSNHAVLIDDKIYLGSGSVWSVKPLIQDDGTTIVKLGSKEFFFDADKRHTQTRDIYTKHILESFSYDAQGLLESITDRFGNATTLIRDGSGTLLSIQAPHGQSTAITIDDSGDITSIGYEDSSSYNFVYENHLMTQEQEPEGNTFTHTFDATGKVEKVIDAEQGEWLFANTASSDASNYTIERASGDKLDYKESFLDNTGMLKTEEILPWGESIMYARSVHEETSSVEVCGVKTVKTYKQESNGTLTKDPITDKKILDTITQSMPSGLTKSTTFTRSYEYNGTALLTKTQSATINNTATFTTTKDYENATQTTLSAEGIQSIETFDASNDLLLSSQYGNLEPIHYTYDDKGRLLSTAQGDRTTTYAYDDRGNLASITDAKGKVTAYAYDQVDRLITITYPDNHTTHFGYDSNGNMTVLTTPHPSEHTFAYNGVNKRTSYTSPLQKATTYIYDKQRRVTQIIKPSGKSIATEYTNGRVESIITPEGVTSYTYNCGNNPATITKENESLAFTYDGTLLMALNQSGILNQTLEFSYDNNFNVTSFAYANGITNYLYNRDNRLIKSGNFTLSRDAQNSLVTKLSDDTYTQERKYNKYGELIKLEDGFFDYTLTRDKTKITKKREVTTEYRELLKDLKWLKKFRWFKPIKIKQIKSLVNYRYVYDKRDRLTEVYKNGRVAEKYTYDPNGNRASATINGTTTTASYTLDDQLVVYGNNTYAYDDDGYLSQKTTPDGVTSYTYGTLGELREVQTPTQTITYQHNALNQRVAKLIDGVVVEKYLWSDLTTLLAIYDGNDNLLQRFEYSDQRVPTAMTQGSNKYYLHYDQVGSLRAVSDTSGNIIKEITYDTYGNIISESNPTFKVPFGFAGGLYDTDTKLTRFGYRDYDAYTGKWTAKDPIDFAGGDTNLYGYVLGDPVNFVDPRGEFGIKDIFDSGWGIVKEQATRQSFKDNYEYAKALGICGACDFAARKALLTCPALGTGNAECHALVAQLRANCSDN